MSQFNYFAESEQASQQRFKAFRDRILHPVSRLLTACGVTPNILSGVGLLVLVPFVWLLMLNSSATHVCWAAPFLIVHLLLDGLDGPLARLQGKANDAGSLVDMVCDHLGLVIVAVTLVQVELLQGALGCLYLFFYTTSVVLVVLLNRLERPFRYVFRSKYVLYALLGAYGIWGWNSLNYAVPCFIASDLWFSMLGFIRLHAYLQAPTHPAKASTPQP